MPPAARALAPYQLPARSLAEDAAIARVVGAPAPRATLVGRMRDAAATGAVTGERDVALVLGRLCMTRGVHVADAVALLLRALELTGADDDGGLRREIAAHLVALGRHDEAADVLRGSESSDEVDALEAGLAAGDAAARAGDAGTAMLVYRELAVAYLGDPRPLERLASVGAWGSASLATDRASDAWLEAGARLGDVDGGLLDLARAFEVAPSHRRAAEAYADSLTLRGRHEEADEVLREHGQASGAALEIAMVRQERAHAAQAFGAELSAVLDALAHGLSSDEGETALVRLLDATQGLARLEPSDAREDARAVARQLSQRVREQQATLRADGLLDLAESLQGAAKALVLALASEAFAEAGSRTRAHRTARQACLAAPVVSRARVALLATGLEDDADASDLEAAIGLVPPRTHHHRTLARLAARQGRYGLSVTWLRRAVALRPGDGEFRQRLLATLAAASSGLGAEALGSTLLAVAAEPYPVGDVAAKLGQALDRLASVDARKAAVVGRSMTQLVGPLDDIVEATIRAGLASRQAALALEVVVQQAVVEGADTPSRWLRAVDLATSVDLEAAAAHLSQAASHHAEANAVRNRLATLEERLPELEGGARSDAEIDLATARAWLAEHDEAAETAARCWRTLGGLRWDLANDTDGAEEAFYYAAVRSPLRGFDRYRADLALRCGAEETLARLKSRVASFDDADDSGTRGVLEAVAAECALELGDIEAAEALGRAAVERRPSCSRALATLERLATARLETGDVVRAGALLEGAYRSAARHASGPHGARAAYHRGARLLEAVGQLRPALELGLRAVAAGPSLGASRTLVDRVAGAMRRDQEGDLLAVLDLTTQSPDAFEGAPAAAEALQLASILAASVGSTTLVSRATQLSTPPEVAATLRDADRPDLGASGVVTAERGATAASHADREALGGREERFDESSLPPSLRRPPNTPSSVRERSPLAGPSQRRSAPNVARMLPEEQELERQGAHRELSEKLERRLGEAPSEERAGLRLRLARLAEEHLHDLSGAAAHLEAYLAEDDPASFAARADLARILEQLGRTVDAAAQWEEVLLQAEFAPDRLLAAVRVATILLDVGDVPRAETVLGQVADLPSTTELLLLRLAIASPPDDGSDELLDIDGAEANEFHPSPSDKMEAFGIVAAPPVLVGHPRVDPRTPEPAGAVDHDELEILQHELEDGAFEAGNQLAAIYARHPGLFQSDLLEVRRHQARLRPGDVGVLAQLSEAARAVGPPWRAAAVDHVLAVFRGTEGPEPPRLSEVPTRPEKTARLLFGHLSGTVVELLGVLARAGLGADVAHREATPRGDRLSREDASPLAGLIDAICRHFGLADVPLFHRRPRGPLSVRVLLTPEPAVMLQGAADVASPQLAFALGGALAATRPGCDYAEGLAADDLQRVLDDLTAAFGPVKTPRTATRSVDLARRAQELWEVVRGADERLARNLCESADDLAAGVARHLAGRARRRAGLFACGDLHTALVQTAAELDLSASRLLQDPDGLREICTHPAIANLVELALDPTYAECRWHRATVPPPDEGMR